MGATGGDVFRFLDAELTLISAGPERHSLLLRELLYLLGADKIILAITGVSFERLLVPTFMGAD